MGHWSNLIYLVAPLACLAVHAWPARAGDATRPAPAGLRVFHVGHSFHAGFIGPLLAEVAASDGITGHSVGVSMLGGSRAIQHWELPPDKNKAKAALLAGKVDVLTLSCMERPDEGIELFAKLAVEHNPQVRITLQELWIPEDHWPFDAKHRIATAREHFDQTKLADLRQTNAAYCKVMEDYVAALNAKLGKRYVAIVPDTQAAYLLREKIAAGQAPGLTKASDLFADAWGHAAAPLQLLSAYTHFAVIYRRSPIGLPIPPRARKEGVTDEKLNRLLQEIAWEAVTHHPMSGVKAE